MTTTNHYKRAYVDLSQGTIENQGIDQEEARKFIGGRGLATKWLYDAGVAKMDALSPEAPLIFIAGPLTGAQAPTAGRYMVVAKAPLNNLIGSANSGGTWGAKLKYAGYDALYVVGKAEKPVYLYVNADGVEIRDAEDLWGLESFACDAKLKERYGADANVLCIGPAGEAQTLLSCVMNDSDRAAGRGGLGAVMGSKNLKAIVVEAKTTTLAPADKDAMVAAFKASMEKIKANDVTATGLPAYGTAILVNVINSIGALPTNNWQESYFEKADDISGETLAASDYYVSNSYCHKCPIGCGRLIERQGEKVGGPEYEPLWAYGSDCGISDLPAITEANHLCNDLGIDAIGAPCTIAAAMELYQRGIIKDEDCDGVPLKWGSSEAIIEWTKRMARPESDLAKLMADGSAALCDHYGVPEYSMSSKKQELPAYDGRAIQGIGLNYATSNRGGCHVRGYTISPEVLGLPTQYDRTEAKGKGALVKGFQDLTAAIDSLGLCLFTSFAMGAPDYAALYSAATGFDVDADELLEIGERIYNLERLFNKEAGMEASADTLPKRLLEEPIPAGPSEGMVSKLDEMLPEYYEARGWENAFPTEATIEKLGL